MTSAKDDLCFGPIPSPLRDTFDRFEGKVGQHISKEDKKSLLITLSGFLDQNQYYDINFAHRIERFRYYLEDLLPRIDSFRPKVIFSIKVRHLRFLDPANGIFALQCEASVGTPIRDAIEFLRLVDLEVSEQSLCNKASIDGLIWFRNDDIERRLATLLKVRHIDGEIENWYEYYRFGSSTGNIWLIQNFTIRLHQVADFRNFPFDRFVFVSDFATGLGGDVVGVEFSIDSSHDHPVTLFSNSFSSGEFEVLKESASLKAIAYCQDSTCYFENFARLQFTLRRVGAPLLLRIVLPLVLLVGILFLGAFYVDDKIVVCTQLIPAFLFTFVALQLTASQWIPRGALFSRMDGMFALSYLLTVILFFRSLFGAPTGFCSELVVIVSYVIVSSFILFVRR